MKTKDPMVTKQGKTMISKTRHHFF